MTKIYRQYLYILVVRPFAKQLLPTVDDNVVNGSVSVDGGRVIAIGSITRTR